MGGRNPSGGSPLRPGDGYEAPGGPLGVALALALFVAVAVALVVGSLEPLLAPVLPMWLFLPVVLLSTASLAVAGLVGVIAFDEWRRVR